ncbi:cystatin-B-like isoform 3-T3 [Cyanocitta cristata]
MLCGGAPAARPATDETQRIAEQVKAQLEEKEGKTFDVFTAVEFKTQVVAGTNYFIKTGAKVNTSTRSGNKFNPRFRGAALKLSEHNTMARINRIRL